MTHNYWVAVPRAHRFTAILLGAALILAASEAGAWSYSTCDGSRLKWNANRATMAISTTSFPAGTVWDNQLQNAMAHWNSANSRMRFYVGRDTNGTYGSGNGVNEVVLGNIDGVDGTLAVTRTSSHCYWAPFLGWEFGIDETDVIFDAAEPWTLSPWSPWLVFRVFESTALHEFGHALGLLHESRWLATMHPISPKPWIGHYREFDPLPDDRAGLRALYGGDGTATVDVAASPFKLGASRADRIAPLNFAAAGSVVEFEFTFGNMGTSRQVFDIEFYLSDNDFISRYDQLLGRNYGASAGAGALGTFTRTVAIPASTAPGTYFLGYMLDPDNVLAESNEDNAYQELLLPIQVYVEPPTITPVAEGPVGLDGWFTGNVTLTWRIDSVQPLTSQQDCQARSVRTNTPGVTYTCIASNVGGTSSRSSLIRRDATPPAVHAVAKPARNAAGWRKAPVTVTFIGSDATSGVTGCTQPAYFANEGTGFSATGHCVNGAGLRSLDVVADNIDIDLIAPSVEIAVPADRAVYALNSVVSVAYGCSDALSGIASCTAPLATGATLDTSMPRSGVAFTVRGVDAAGNVTRRTVRYSVQ